MTPEPQPTAPPTPALLFDTLNAHQRTEAIKTGIELGVFTEIAQGKTTVAEIAKACDASERGTRILCDFLVIIGFLTKQNGAYGLTPDSAMFLDKHSPAYMGSVIDFILSPMLTDNFKHLTEAVKKGGAAGETQPLEPEHPIWVKFARAMLVVAKENAQFFGASDRYHTIPGSAFDVDYGTDYDIVLLTNFLHHFDPPTCEALLRKIHAALKDGGRAVTLEFVPNEDRVTPPQAAAFSMMMLGATPAGDAYTFPELEAMFRNAGFARSELHELPPTIERVVISSK